MKDEKVVTGPKPHYNLSEVQQLQKLCTHIPPADWQQPDKYDPVLVQIQQEWDSFVQSSGIKTMTVLDGTELFLVPPCMPWYAPWNNDVDSTSTKMVAVVMHYLTSQEERGYIGYPN